MLERSRRRILSMLGPDDVVLDVGGWADPFERADWVIDLMPYETRGLYEREGWVEPREREAERFSAETWIQRDLCDREPYPFENGSIDFAICSQTLEDLRDPIWVCRELARIAKAGYIEVPSRLEEQSWGVDGPFAGWGHHRWLIDAIEGGLEFVVKPHSLHGHPDQRFPPGFWETLTEEERVQTLWWEGGFDCRERVLIGAEEGERYLSELVRRELAARGLEPSAPRSRIRGLARRIAGRALG
ncbi:MAG: class I SAM-dependent methyltransferase [Solirubrobacterales bacterium]